jgi:hypothetical protein
VAKSEARVATKLFPADQAFSNYIRGRDGWQCKRCGTAYAPPTKALHCSHFYSRGKWGTRFDPDNCIALCYGCHRYWDKHIGEYEDYKKAQLGDDFDGLTLRAWNRSPMGSGFWKKLTKKQAEELFNKL